MRFPFIQQFDSMDCGPTCLAMIAKHYGKTISIHSLREKTQIGKEGVNLLGISEAAEQVGFRTQCVQLTYKSLVEDATLPAVIHWDQNHFVVVYKISKKKFYIADPASKTKILSEKEFRSQWVSNVQDDEGIALLLEPSPTFYVSNEEREKSALGFTTIFRYIFPYKSLVYQLVFGLGIGSILQLILPFLTQSVVDVGVNTGNIHFVYIVLIAQLALFIGRMAVEFVRSWILLHISSRINISILTDFLIKLMKLPVSYFDSKKTGDILQRMNDHSRIESFLTGSSLNILFSLLNLFIFSAVLAFYNSLIFFIFIITSILYSSWVFIFMKQRRKIDHKRFDISSKDQSSMIQLVQGMQEIKLHGVEKPLRWKWEQLQAKLFKLGVKILSLQQWQQAGGFVLNEGKNIAITFISAKAVIDGDMTLGSMLAVQYIIGQLNSPIEQMIGFAQSWQNAKISMERLNEIHQLEDEEPSNKFWVQELPPSFLNSRFSASKNILQDYSLIPGKFMTNGNGSYKANSYIHFQNVCFTYPGAGNEPVLKDINLSIPQGKTTAIVGVSGSGKTTLLKLLLKFYQPQKGDIRLNFASLASISHKAWRNHCGVVMQESFIFSDSIAKNIAVGVERINHNRLYEAIQMANIGEFIEELPLGVHTKIGAEGIGLSMGQKQRILIARAIYRNPDFIFFDEATNSLDANNESRIIQNLQHFFKGRTVIVVAHRLSTVKHADQIVVLNKGIITEKGNHNELVNLKGEYFTLVKNQLELGE